MSAASRRLPRKVLAAQKLAAGVLGLCLLAMAGWGVYEHSLQGSTVALGSNEICTNSCKQANNGVCDDGRRGHDDSTLAPPVGPVGCDLGTDCADCGIWKRTGPASWLKGKGKSAPPPIKALLHQKVDVRIKRWPASRSGREGISFAYTHPDHDSVSYELNHTGTVEGPTTELFRKLLKGHCVSPSGARAMVVDVGAGLGWFTLFAARMGCHVIAVEPDPTYRTLLEYNVHVNGLASLVDIRDHKLSPAPGGPRPWNPSTFPLKSGQVKGCSVVAGYDVFPNQDHASDDLRKCKDKVDINNFSQACTRDYACDGFSYTTKKKRGCLMSEATKSTNSKGSCMYKKTRLSFNAKHVQAALAALSKSKSITTLDELVHQDVLLLRVDVAGWEWSVMKGARRLLTDHSVEHIFLQYNPYVLEQRARVDTFWDQHTRDLAVGSLLANVNSVIDLMSSGYRVAVPSPVLVSANSTLTLDEVVAANLKHDLRDISHMAAGSLNCPLPSALASLPHWRDGCNTIPLDSHPKSLRSILQYNITLWATKNKAMQKMMTGGVGVLNLKAPPHAYFTKGMYGVGRVLCSKLEPVFQVRHRCHCTHKAVCGQVEKETAKAAESEKIVSQA